MKALMEKIDRREAVVGIVGLGYVGLPLAIAFAECGFRVIGLDADESKLKALRAGRSYLSHVEPAEFSAHVEEGKIGLTDNYLALKECDAFIVCVPTPLSKNREPDLSFIEAAAGGLWACAEAGKLFVLESSTYPGTTREVFAAILTEGKKLEVGRDIFVAHSPERADPGNQRYKTRNVPKVVGGLTRNCLCVASRLYRKVIDVVVDVEDAETAEMVKIFENTYRLVNISLVNELKVLCHRMGIDVWSVVKAAATKPFGFQSFKPGPGTGGHCFVPGTLVFTERGPLPIQSVKVDDRVLSEGGKHCRVLKLMERYFEDDVVTVKVGGMIPATMTPDHGVYAIEVRDGVGGKIEKIPAGRLIVGAHHICWPSTKIDTSAARVNEPSACVMMEGNQAFHAVQSVERHHYRGMVYNLHVEETNKYVVPIGLVANCLPVDPFYLTWKARQVDTATRFIELAGEVNAEMPRYVVERVTRALNEHSKSVQDSNLLVLGVAYKADVNDVRESPAIKVIELLHKLGASIEYHDPRIPEVDYHGLKIQSVALTSDRIKAVDAVLVLTDHTDVDYAKVAELARIVVDTRCVEALRSIGTGRYYSA